jgi:tetratricopeptide (TPR) repeat protein
MSEPNDPTNPERAPTEEPTQTGGRRAPASAHAGPIRDDDLDFEADALLDSLLNDPFPSPIASAIPGPKLHEPFQRLYSQDEVTVVGREIEELLARSTEESVPPPQAQQRPTAPAPPRGSPSEITVIGQGLDELLARTTSAESIPPAAPLPSIRTPTAPRPAIPPRPAPRARSSRAPGTPQIPRPEAPRPAAGTSAPPPAGAKLETAGGTAFAEETEDEETRVIRVPSEMETQEPTVRLPPSSTAPAMPGFSHPALQPESFVPPGAYMPDSLSPLAPTPSQAATPMPMPTPGRAFDPSGAAKIAVGPRLAVPSQYESEPPTAQVAAFDPKSLRAPAVPSLTREPAPPPAPASPRPAAPTPVVPMPAAPESTVATFPPPSFPPGKDPVAREAWIARAELFESEAQAATDPAMRARSLLAASELWAIIGDLPRAREVATEASAFVRNMTMAGRQQRWLAARDRDFTSVLATLETEARSASTPEARAHAAYLAAEVQRLPLDDAASASQKFDATQRPEDSDPRGYLMKLAEQLGTNAGPPKLKWPEVEEFAVFASATEELSFLRGAHVASPPARLSAFDDARRGFAQGDRKLAADAVLRLADVEGLERAAKWLASALLAHDEDTRARALALTKTLAIQDGSASARRALAARSLELGDKEALAGALEGESAAFDARDRVVLTALSSGALEGVEALVDELAASPSGQALATAARLANVPSERDAVSAGPPEQRTALALGRRLARGGTSDLGWLEAELTSFAEVNVRHPLARVLGLELALAKNSVEAVALALSEWPRPDHDPAAQRDRELLSALLHEIGGESEPARSAYERAHAADPASEAAVRALLPALAAGETAELLERLGEAETSGSQAALHFVEAALQRGGDAGERFHTLLEKAVEADPKLVLPYRLGEHLARRQGDPERLLSWLRARRPAIGDRLELALDLVREALLVAENDLDAAAALLREASEARPYDIAITELYERVAPSGDFSRAAVRETAAERARGLSRRRVLLEAAFEYERSGDRDGAIRCARLALESDGSELSRIVLTRVALGTNDSIPLGEDLLARAKETDDAALQREIYAQLSELEAARGNTSGALLWQNAILERSPRELSALRRLEFAHVRADRRSELERVLTALADALGGSEGAAAARVAARLRLAAGNWSGVRKLAELSVRADPNSVWALRMLSAHARAADDPEATQAVERRLFELSSRPVDKATLALRAAEAATRLERWEDAQALLENALDHAPDHLVALKTLADVLEQRAEYGAAARAMEAVAEASRVDAHKVEAWYSAGLLWLDKVDDTERGRSALEQAVALDLEHEDAVARLQSIYVARGDRQRLAELLQRRLERTTDPEERIAIEVARGRALAEIGEPAAAKAALAAALDANPNHFEALEAFAQLCLGEGDWHGAELAFIRLARHAPDAARQAQIYRKLGELYDVALPNPERAELAYQEVLKREPNDASTVDRLVAVYGRLGTPERAVALASQLLEGAEAVEDRRERTIRLASVLEQIAGNRKQAETTLEKARREWPHDASVLRALIELHNRGGDHRAAQLLLDRAAMDARRALGTGRFESALFETLATVADLRGSPDGAAVAHATLAALAGDEMPVRGGGAQAGEAPLDDLLAPDLLGTALRALLTKTGAMLDQAYPVDLRALRAGPLPPSSADFLHYVQEVARPFGLSGVELLTSPALGLVCMPAGSSPPTLIFGQALLESTDDAARYCLLVRALTVLKGRASALARTAPIDLGPMIGGLLTTFAPSFTPQGVDAKKLAEARAKIQSKNPGGFGDDVTNLALEVTGSIGNRASQLSTAVYQWGNRTALLAVGDPLAALRALSMASGSTGGPPAAGPDRVRWIVRNAEARDLMIFSVSEQYAEARRRLNLGAL